MGREGVSPGQEILRLFSLRAATEFGCRSDHCFLSTIEKLVFKMISRQGYCLNN